MGKTKSARLVSAAVVFDFAKISFAQAEKSCAIEFRVAANVVIRVRMELCSVFVPPKLLRIVFALGIYCARIAMVFLAPHIRAALNQQNFLDTGSKAISQSAH